MKYPWKIQTYYQYFSKLKLTYNTIKVTCLIPYNCKNRCTVHVRLRSYTVYVSILICPSVQVVLFDIYPGVFSLYKSPNNIHVVNFLEYSTVHVLNLPITPGLAHAHRKHTTVLWQKSVFIKVLSIKEQANLYIHFIENEFDFCF